MALSCKQALNQNGQSTPQRVRIGVGYRVGRLTVTAPTEQRKNHYMVWQCRCDCGGGIRLDTRCLQRGAVDGCGRCSKVQPGRKDVSGTRFGKLVAVEPTGDVCGGSAVWRCVCDCGGSVCAPLHQLTSGYRKSCGCLGHPARKDYLGKRFGRLTVTGYAGKQAGMHRWRCACDCGRETVVGQTLLQTGKTRSCGCLQAEIYRDNLKLVDGTSVTILEARKDKLNTNNTSGFTGVHWDRRREKWVAQIRFKGKTYHLGSYDDQRDAVRARRQGEEMHDAFLEWYYANKPPLEAQPQPGQAAAE